MRSRRETRRTVWLAVHFICLAALLSLAPASGQSGGQGPPPNAPAEPQKLAAASKDSPEAAPPEDSKTVVSQPGRKIRVIDVEVGGFLADAGSRMVGDYGSFQVFVVDEATAAAVAGHDAVEVRSDYDMIALNAGPIDTTSPSAAALRALAGTFPGKRLHLVQFAAPVQEAWLDSVKKTGVQIITYLPANAYLVYGEASSIGQLQSIARTSSFVQWDGAYLDGYKIHPRARAVDEKGQPHQIRTDHFAIQMVDDPGANASSLALIDSLKLAPILSQDRFLGYLNVIVRLPANRLDDVARQPEVVSIQPYVVPRLYDERQGQLISGNISGSGPSGPGYLAWLTSKGFTQQQFTASGFAVDVTDDGLDDATTSPNHFGLYINGNISGQSRVVYARREPAGAGEIRGCPGHGTLNAHIIAGYNNLTGFPHTDAAGFRYGLGVAPFVKVGSSVIFDPDFFTFPSYADLQSRAYRDGARISSNSWGADTDGAYNSDAQAYDALVRDAQPAGSAVPAVGNQEMVIVFAAGNAGPGANTAGAPGTGKNVLTVGASENVHSHATANGGNNPAGNDGCFTPDTAANNLSDITGFSSRGPTDDGRVRPDLVAPGTHITGGVFQSVSPEASGTADACFNATSVCALPGGGTPADPDNFFPQGQQFYTTSSGTSHSAPAVAGGAALVRQWFINQGMNPASPAMTKAFLMNSARYLTGAGANDTLPSHSQGMGLMDLGRAFDGTPRILRDQAELFTATGQSFTWTATISDASKPFRVTLAWTDAPGNTTGNAFNNDLDLTVVAGGNVYKGNVFSGPSSITGGSADPRNNVESVFLPAGITGPVAVIVTAANINSNGVPNNASALDQDFALSAYNVVAGTLPVLAVQSAAVTDDDPSIDPNECHDLSLTLKNWGTAGATNVVATLGTSTPGASIEQPSSTYPNLAPGSSSTNTTPFRIRTAASFLCGTPFAMTATVTTNQGTQVLLLALATSANATNFHSGDVPKAIVDLGTIESAVTVSGLAGPIDNVAVSFHLTHTFDGDLVISLVAPDGTTVELTSNNGGGGDDYGTSCGGRTTFDDGAAASIAAAAAPFAGTFRPEQPLSVFAGTSGAAVNGTWRLRIADTAGVDVGTLRCWTLRLFGPGCSSGNGACQVATFADVPPDHGFWSWIESLVAAGITSGCDTNPARYCPDREVTRGQMAVFLLRGIAYPGSASPPTPEGRVFADVPESHPFAGWIEGLSAAGITGGCGTNPARYCPDQSVTRGQVAVFLLRARHGSAYVPPPPPSQPTFADVPLDHPFIAWIHQLAAEGITSGCGSNPTRYCPASPVTRAQMAVFLVRTFNLPH